MSSTLLECPLCFEVFDEDKHCPRLLPCGHTFCTTCIDMIRKGTKIQCPTDLKTMTLKANTLFPKNFALLGLLSQAEALSAQPSVGASGPSTTPQPLDPSAVRCELCEEAHLAVFRCVECQQHLCEAQGRAHARAKSSSTHQLQPLDADTETAIPVPICTEHADPFRYYDKDCGVPLCRDCYALCHHGHTCEPIPQAAADIRTRMGAGVEQEKALVERLGAELDTAGSNLVKLNESVEEAKATIRDAFAEIRRELDRAEAERLEVLEEILTRESAQAQTRIATLRVAIDHSEASVRRAEPLLDKGDVHMLMSAREAMDALAASRATAVLGFRTRAVVVRTNVSASAALAALRDIGWVKEQDTAAPDPVIEDTGGGNDEDEAAVDAPVPMSEEGADGPPAKMGRMDEIGSEEEDDGAVAILGEAKITEKDSGKGKNKGKDKGKEDKGKGKQKAMEKKPKQESVLVVSSGTEDSEEGGEGSDDDNSPLMPVTVKHSQESEAYQIFHAMRIVALRKKYPFADKSALDAMIKDEFTSSTPIESPKPIMRRYFP